MPRFIHGQTIVQTTFLEVDEEGNVIDQKTLHAQIKRLHDDAEVQQAIIEIRSAWAEMNSAQPEAAPTNGHPEATGQ